MYIPSTARVLALASSVAAAGTLLDEIIEPIADIMPRLRPAVPAAPAHGPAATMDRLASTHASIEGLDATVRQSLIRLFERFPGSEKDVDAALGKVVRAQEHQSHASANSKQSSHARPAALHQDERTSGLHEHVVSERFPEHRLRYKRVESLGVDEAKQYSGYLDFGDDLKEHLFFWFFESRNDPSTDPVVLWLNGGPGCSSMLGLFGELGPSQITEDLKPKSNVYSWTNNASFIFVDQPVGVGMSYSEDGDVPVNSVVAERDAYALLELFFTEFPQYAQGEFHVAGESYGGHYVPALGAEIWSHKDRSFNLTSLMIGNGLTDPVVQYTSYADMACGRGGYDAVLDDDSCAQMEADTPECVDMIQKCYDARSEWACVAATSYCNNVMFRPYLDAGRNFYDVTMVCDVCYPEQGYIAPYLDQSSVRKALGAEESPEYDSCSSAVSEAFVNDGDWMRPYGHNVTELLEGGVRVLVYAGDKDFAVNWIGNERWTRKVDWRHHAEFAAEPLKPWVDSVTGEPAGEVRSFDKLTFVRAYGGGHLYPRDQPEHALDLVNRWLADEAFDS